MTATDTVPGGPERPGGAGTPRPSRFSLAERIGRSGFYLVTLIAVVWSFKTIEIIPEPQGRARGGD
jgi:hypothetical protein